MCAKCFQAHRTLQDSARCPSNHSNEQRSSESLKFGSRWHTSSIRKFLHPPSTVVDAVEESVSKLLNLEQDLCCRHETELLATSRKGSCGAASMLPKREQLCSNSKAGKAEAWLGFEVFRPVTAAWLHLEVDAFSDIMKIPIEVRCVELFHNNIPAVHALRKLQMP